MKGIDDESDLIKVTFVFFDMSDNLLIIFVKNILLGKVKTRLAKSIGDVGAFEVYKGLVELTENETKDLSCCDTRVYFSDVIIESKWENQEKYVQEGNDLGEKMKNAIQDGFKSGYQKVVLIGSDLPDLNAEILLQSFEILENKSVVIGPAEDGGYYLIGMDSTNDFIFHNKPWSNEMLLEQTLNELDDQEVSYQLLQTLNDIDTLDDLKNSSVSTKFEHLYELSRSNKRSI